jgi:hypothetical protein
VTFSIQRSRCDNNHRGEVYLSGRIAASADTNTAAVKKRRVLSGMSSSAAAYFGEFFRKFLDSLDKRRELIWIVLREGFVNI